ncbi:MAG: hypothetical protein LQ348_007100 [Seirophora lacunosa]|nr:MAG: hypothetical protein LQ344_007578 [Seirophora lacunosa]KAI4170490.1 MAG: hypothetical protein LQ348_007100 [Seirophora lacunosa]
MATVVAMQPRRRALGELSATRSNKIAMTKHLQSIAAQAKPASTTYEIPSGNFNFTSTVKRSFDAYDDADQENVDPDTHQVLGKKAKGSTGAPVKPHAPKFTLTTVTESAKITRATLGVKPRVEGSAVTLDLAPGSSKVKHTGIAARARQSAKRVVRVGPFVSNGHVPSTAPVSVGGETQHASTPRVGKKTRKAWEFVIREDTPDEELTNLMEHSTHTLDISDDENRGKFRDDSDKENIPPPGCPASAVRPVGRRDLMTDEVRTPLGKLNAAEYYAAGYDAASVVNAPQEDLPASSDRAVLDHGNLEFGSIDGEILGHVNHI